MIVKDGKRVIYVAGAYSANHILDVFDNMRIGIETSTKLFQLGFSPFAPWLDYHFCLQLPREHLSVGRFYDYSIDFLQRCDAVLVVDNQRNIGSSGTNKELAKANELGIPVFYTLQDLLDWEKND